MKDGLMRMTRLCMFAGAASVAGAAIADSGPKYTFGELAYTRVDYEDFDVDGDLFGIAGSIAVTDMFHLFATYDDGELEGDGGGDVDASTVEFGGGINYALSDTMDIVGQLAWVSAEFDAGRFGGIDEDGYRVSGGLRAMMTPQFELNGGLTYVDIEDADDTAIEFGGVYSFTDLFAVTAGASIGDEVSSFRLGARLYFDL